MVDVSIVMGALGRPEETRRTLKSYTKLTYPSWELIFMNPTRAQVVEDNLEFLYDEFKDILPIRYYHLEERESRTPAVTWNTGMSYAEGKFVIVCSADILLSYPDLIERYLAQYSDRRISTNIYFLTKDMTDMLGTMDWFENPDVIQTFPAFFSAEINGQTNAARKSAGLLTHHTGMTKDRWEWFGKFRTEVSHLVNDQDVVMRERALDVGVDTMEEYVAYHQAHPSLIGSYQPVTSPGWQYENERQARLLEPAKRDAT